MRAHRELDVRVSPRHALAIADQEHLVRDANNGSQRLQIALRNGGREVPNVHAFLQRGGGSGAPRGLGHCGVILLRLGGLHGDREARARASAVFHAHDLPIQQQRLWDGLQVLEFHVAEALGAAARSVADEPHVAHGPHLLKVLPNVALRGAHHQLLHEHRARVAGQLQELLLFLAAQRLGAAGSTAGAAGPAPRTVIAPRASSSSRGGRGSSGGGSRSRRSSSTLPAIASVPRIAVAAA